MTESELVEYLASRDIRQTNTAELIIERDYARRERDLATNPPYELYQIKRVRALNQELKRRDILQHQLQKSKLTPEFIDQLKSAIDLRDIMNDLGILVIPSGHSRERYECPAHLDKHPSGCVYVDYPQHYHCFQCGAHGDAYDALMAFRGLRFLQAIEYVAGRAGVPLPK